MSASLVQKFLIQLGQVIDMQAAAALLAWDQEVYMPPKGAQARGEQLATLSAMAHRLFTGDEMGALIASLQEQKDSLDDDMACLLRETTYDYERARKLPESFVQRFAQEQSKAYEAWVKARECSEYALFAPHLETLLSLSQEKAEYLGYEDSPYDALLEDYERGTTTAQLKTLFSTLAERQRVLVSRITASSNQPDLKWLDQEWDEGKQWDLSLQMLRDMGFDFEAGRQDRAVHPFTTNFDRRDVRVTTRTHPRELFSCLSSSIHEGGHALYEQGFLEKDRRTLLAQAPSLGIHESQSRMWENMIGRSLPFWKHYTPQLQMAFGDSLRDVTPEQIYHAINYVQPSLIRVEADECTYNLHIMVRFEIEVALVEGDLTVADVPAAWNEKIKSYLGLTVPDDAQGCLQDIHWAHGCLGYFPTYALGNLYAAQLFEQLEADFPEVWMNVAQGDFSAILNWLRPRVHELGRRQSASEIVESATGKAPDAEAYLRYLERKYTALYALG